VESFVEENTLLKDDLAQCRFEHVLAQKSDDIHESEASNLGIAAQHLGQWSQARAFFKQWAKHGAHTSTGDLVSIIIPTHNRPELLKRALQSAIHQLYENIEIIVVNDAGQDVSHVVDALQTERTIKLINHSKNQYLAAARNTGLNAANGKYICYLDDDDQLYLHHIGHLVQILSCTNAKAAQAMPYYLTPDKESMTGYFLKGCPFRPFTLQEVLVLNIVPVNCILHEKSLVNETGLFDTEFRTLEDWDFWIRLRQHTHVEQSRVITSCITNYSDDKRMTSSPATFIHHHATILKRYRDLALAVGGSDLLRRQLLSFSRLRRGLEEIIVQNQRAVIALIKEDSAVSEDACLQKLAETTESLPGRGAATDYLDVIFLPGNSPKSSDILNQATSSSNFNYVSIIRESALDSLSPNWFIRSLMHLESDPKLEAVVPVELVEQSLEHTPLEEDCSALGVPLINITDISAITLRRLCCHKLLKSNVSDKDDGLLATIETGIQQQKTLVRQAHDIFLTSDTHERSRSPANVCPHSPVVNVAFYLPQMDIESSLLTINETIQHIEKFSPGAQTTFVSPQIVTKSSFHARTCIQTTQDLRPLVVNALSQTSNDEEKVRAVLNLAKELISLQHTNLKDMNKLGLDAQMYKTLQLIFSADTAFHLISTQDEISFFTSCLQIMCCTKPQMVFQISIDGKLSALKELLLFKALSKCLVTCTTEAKTYERLEKKQCQSQCILTKTHPSKDYALAIKRILYILDDEKLFAAC